MKRTLSAWFLIGALASVQAQHVVDSLKQVLSVTPDEAKVPVYEQLIIHLWLNHPDSAMIYAREATALADKLHRERDRAVATRLTGGVYYYRGEYDSSIWYSHRALALSEQIHDSTLMTSCINNIGLSYYSVGSYPEALEYLLRSLNMKRRLHVQYGLAQTLNNVGLVYLELKDYQKALTYFEEALSLGYHQADLNIQLYSSNNIGLTYFRRGDLDKAEKFYDRSLEIATRINNVVWHTDALLGQGDVYFARGRVEDARRLYQRSLSLSKRINEKSGMATAYASLSAIYMKANRYDSALILLRRSLSIARAIHAREQVIENYNAFHTLFLSRHQYDSALHYQTMFINLRDSVFDENLARNIGAIQLSIQEAENRHQLADKDAEIRRIRTQAYMLVALVILVTVFSFFWYRSFRRQRQLARDLEKKNKEVIAQSAEIHDQKEALMLSNQQLEAAQQKIREQNDQLRDLNRNLQSTVNQRTQQLEEANKELKLVNLELDNFIYKSSHDIKGPLVRLLGVCHVALLDVKDDTALNYFNMLYLTARHLNDIFDRLKTVSDINSMPVKHEPVYFEDILERVKSNLRNLEGFSEVAISLSMKGPEPVYSDTFLMETVFHNMIENAVRFQKKTAPDEKYILIDVNRHNGTVHISFKDNGVGIKPDDVEHMFKMFSRAALEHQTVGLGLYIVKQCVSKLNGTINLVQSSQAQTEFEITLPAN